MHWKIHVSWFAEANSYLDAGDANKATQATFLGGELWARLGDATWRMNHPEASENTYGHEHDMKLVQ